MRIKNRIHCRKIAKHWWLFVSVLCYTIHQKRFARWSSLVECAQSSSAAPLRTPQVALHLPPRRHRHRRPPHLISQDRQRAVRLSEAVEESRLGNNIMKSRFVYMGINKHICIVLSFSFLLWNLLSLFTLGYMYWYIIVFAIFKVLLYCYLFLYYIFMYM